MKVVVVKTAPNGNVDLDDLRSRPTRTPATSRRS
jgi:glycine cleavage system protein P-like pyridoxal-binding family